MISDALRGEIQSAYSAFLEAAGHRPRTGQKQMVAAIARCLMHSQPIPKIIAIEAGTGTGKTLAYLLAGLPIARELGKTLVVSTATVALQEQLMYKDLPDVIAKTGMNFGYSLVKGRGRYLCQMKLDKILTGGADDDQMAMYMDGGATALQGQTLRLYESMDDALRHKTWDGDRDNWDDTIEEQDWRPLTSDRYQCLGRSCAFVSDCTFFNARNDLEDVQCLVTNHDLVLADLALGGGAILPAPEDAVYVFDEAHHLGDKARNHFSGRFRVGTSMVFFNQLQESLAKLSSSSQAIKGLSSLVAEITASIPVLIEQVQSLRPVVATYFVEGSERGFDKQRDYRFRNGLLPDELVILAQDLSPKMDSLQSHMERLTSLLEDYTTKTADSEPKSDAQAWFPVVGQWLARAESYASLWKNMSGQSGAVEAEYARWCRMHESTDDYELFSAPILAGDILSEQIWKRCAGAVLTSATLTALGKFDRMRLHTGLPESMETMALQSPFNYQQNAELRIPQNAPDPKDVAAHDQYLIDELPSILDENEGSLVLFSSGRQMDYVYENLNVKWQKRILIQGSRSKQALIVKHKERVDAGEGSTLFGLASFAEGVDLPGAYCQQVVIAKLPFSVPTAPEEEALSEWVESRGGKPFFEISLPDASMRLVQATGRLLRSESDTGAISILDNRILNKSYGKQLIAALPPYRFLVT